MSSFRYHLARIICGTLPPILAKHIGKRLYPLDLAYREAAQFTRRSRTGSPFTGFTSDFHAYPFAIHGYSELRYLAVARALCPAGSTIIEIGANVGTETVGLSDIVGSKGRVFAFEPLPANLEMLKIGLSQLRHPNVEIMPYALTDQRGKTQFVIPPKHASGTGYVVGAESANDSEAIWVECFTLDALAETLGPATMIFMDVEGSEVSVLRGGSAYIASHKPTLFLEAKAKHLKRTGCTLRDLLHEITQQGYIAVDTKTLTFKPVDVESARGSNWLCVHQSESERLPHIEAVIRRAFLMPFVLNLNPISGSRSLDSKP